MLESERSPSVFGEEPVRGAPVIILLPSCAYASCDGPSSEGADKPEGNTEAEDVSAGLGECASAFLPEPQECCQ